MPNLIPVIGLEIHVELKTKTKMFCSCPNDPFASEPNIHVCEICLAHPGTLPVPNRAAIANTVKIARALGCHINEISKFDRKHYFYPDLPKGYQISQYDQPVGEHGSITLDLRLDNNPREFATIGITRVHLEEDTAQLTHASETSPPVPSSVEAGKSGSLSFARSTSSERPDLSATSSRPSGQLSKGAKERAGERSRKDFTHVNFNRAGVPLVEIVSEPDIESAVEAKWYCQELQKIFRCLEVSNADMEKGQMRCEANVSVQEEGAFAKKGGTIAPKDGCVLNPKVEVKNINSFRAVEKAIDFEIKRQTELIAKGERWQQATRGWDDTKQVTVHQRGKETSADYRYFPEPDIPPFNPAAIAGTITLPELPLGRRARFQSEYGFSLADAQILTADKEWADFAEATVSELTEWLHALPDTHTCTVTDKNIDRAPICKSTQDLVRLSGGWLTSKLMGAMSERAIDIRVLKVKPENFAELIALIYAGRVNSTNAQKILGEMLDSGVDKDPTHIMEEKGYGQISDEGKIGAVVDEVIKNYPQQVAAFRGGKEPILKFLIGMAMKATEGSADPQVVEKLLRARLSSLQQAQGKL